MTRATVPGKPTSQAVVFVPYGEPVNEAAATRFWTHCVNRRYEFVALVRDWSTVDRMLNAGTANVVVMPSTERTAAGEDGETVRLWQDPGPGSGESTVGLEATRKRALANSRFISGRLPRERVRELLDGSGEVTGPVGVDPETIAALRRIARRLGGPPNESPSR